MRSAESHWHAETLGGADHNVGAEFARGAQQREREQVGGDDAERTGGMGLGEKVRVVVNRAPRVRILHQHAKDWAPDLERPMVPHHNLNAERPGAGPDDIDGLRMAGVGDKKHAAGTLLHAAAEHHGFGRGGAFIEHRGVGNP